jgi:FAD binding domain/Berberine and berberine like
MATHVTPGNPQYHAVLDKQFNKRFRATPDYVCLVSSTDAIVAALNEALQDGRRVVATSGGHCLEGFVSDPDARVIIDVSPMKRVYHDAERRAIAVEAGATVGETFRALAEMWNVVIPLGEYPGIGMGGHVAGGAFGFLCRQHGLAADYLYAVEVVTVDANGHPRAVIATRDPTDPNRDLWWAHTGGGAGNFGIITRYWFRASDARGSAPASLLPHAPTSVTTFKAEWNWRDINDSAYRRLLQNHGEWCERNSDAASPNARLFSLLILHRRQLGKIVVRGVSTAGSAAERQMHDHLTALSAGVPAATSPELTEHSWLEFALNPFPDLFAGPPGGVSVKVKDALLKRRLTDRQIDLSCEYLTRDDFDVMGGMMGLATYGGRVNTIPSDATASSQRSAILDLACTSGWVDPREAELNLTWVRAFYHDLFSDSGGVPVPGDAYDGALINHPDVDLADSALNTSGVPWSTLYYKQHYPRLQHIKTRWDPLNVFRHALSIHAASRLIGRTTSA